MTNFSIALVHHPILDRQGAVITTAITNLDLHDLARSAVTYGARSVFIVHPVAAQRELATRVKTHWTSGAGSRRIPTREAAMDLLQIVPSLDDVYAALGGRSQLDLYVTSARSEARIVSGYGDARARIARAERPTLVVFGTGWGLAQAVLEGADYFLAPLEGAHPNGYNHLSVRAACAIILDRLLATK
ncbi:MAG TPA: RNA methyltransferase [Polyangiaceae bacterium]|nr:RNA methyltransferase [Polyangiaceae bacterium]